MVHVTPELYAKGWELYSNRLDKDWGVIDCISFVIMEERNLTEALTSDHHFEQSGSRFYCNFRPVLHLATPTFAFNGLLAASFLLVYRAIARFLFRHCRSFSISMAQSQC